MPGGGNGWVHRQTDPSGGIAGGDRAVHPAPGAHPAESAVPPGDDCIDWQAAWANLDGDRNLLSELALLFLDDLPQQMEAIHAAIEKAQGQELGAPCPPLERLGGQLRGQARLGGRIKFGTRRPPG